MSTLNEEQLLKLRKELPKCWAITLAEKCDCTSKSVENVFNNKCKDIDLIAKVINEAIKLRDKKRAKLEKLNQKIAS